MFLYLRAQDLYWMSVALIEDDGTILKEKRMDSRPETILSFLWIFLEEQKVDWKKIKSLWIVNGPGSFTALRQSLTIVNSIAFVHSLPVKSVQAKSDETDRSVFNRLLKQRTKRNWQVPFYGAPAMITKAKKSN